MKKLINTILILVILISPILAGGTNRGTLSIKNIPNCIGWWDAADRATVLTNGTSVYQLNDKSASGYNLTQGTTANQPIYITAGYNGKNTIRFLTASAQYLSNTGVTNFINGANQENTIFHVVSYSVDAPAVALSSVGIGSTAAGTKDYFLIQKNTTNIPRVLSQDDAAVLPYVGGVVFPTMVGNYNPHIYTVLKGNPTRNLFISRLDGAVSTTTTVNSTTFVGSSVFTLGARMINNAYGQYHSGDILETIIYNRYLTASEVSRIESYLSKKWGIAI